MKPTLRQIAEAARVDTSTASRVLAGRAQEARIPEATAARVQKAAARLGYRPNLYARFLRTRKTESIGLLVTDLSNPFFATLAGAVEAYARKNGFTTIIATSNEDPRVERAYLQTLRARPVDGLIVTPTPGAQVGRLLREMVRSGLPLVQVDRLLPDLACDAVLCENRQGARKLVEALLQLGCRRPAFATGPAGVFTARERLEGYRQALTGQTLTSERGLVIQGPFTADHGRAAALRFLSRRQPPDAIIAANNTILQGVLEVLHAAAPSFAGLPVAGFDGVSFASCLGRPVIVAEQPVRELGETAATLVLERIKGHRGRPRQLRLPVAIRGYATAGAAPPAPPAGPPGA